MMRSTVFSKHNEVNKLLDQQRYCDVCILKPELFAMRSCFLDIKNCFLFSSTYLLRGQQRAGDLKKTTCVVSRCIKWSLSKMNKVKYNTLFYL